MFDLLVISLFFGMVLSPCVLASVSVRWGARKDESPAGEVEG
jgi:hypothetical protein